MGPAIIPIATVVGEIFTVQSVVTAANAGVVGAAFGAGKRASERYVDSQLSKANNNKKEESDDVYYPAPKNSRSVGNNQYNYRIDKRR